MTRYEFQLIGGDGARLRREQYCLSDPRTAWDHIFAMARTGAPGSELQVLDDRGEVVIRVGIATATALARMRGRGILARPAA